MTDGFIQPNSGRDGVLGFPPQLTVVDTVIEIVREKLINRGFDRKVGPDDDLGEIGLSSLDMVNLMLRVESEYNLQFPEAQMTTDNFRTPARIAALVSTLLRKSDEME